VLHELLDEDTRQFTRALVDFKHHDSLRHLIASDVLRKILKSLYLDHCVAEVLKRDLNVQLVQLRLHPPNVSLLPIDIDESADGVVVYAFGKVLEEFGISHELLVPGNQVVVRVLHTVLLLDFRLLIFSQVVLRLTKSRHKSRIIAPLLALSVVRARLRTGSDDNSFFWGLGHPNILQGETPLGHVL
jgi:hypothetical protein